MLLDPADLSPRPVDDLLAEVGHPSVPMTLAHVARALVLSETHTPRFLSLTAPESPHCDQLGIPFSALPMCP